MFRTATVDGISLAHPGACGHAVVYLSIYACEGKSAPPLLKHRGICSIAAICGGIIGTRCLCGWHTGGYVTYYRHGAISRSNCTLLPISGRSRARNRYSYEKISYHMRNSHISHVVEYESNFCGNFIEVLL